MDTIILPFLFVLLADTHIKTKHANVILNHVLAEITSIRKCLQCYNNAIANRTRWFVMVCDEPHLIIWAPMKNVRLWPAKVMSIDGDMVNVRFFGGFHKHDDLPSNKCFLYSESNPKRTVRMKDKYYEAALQVR